MVRPLPPWASMHNRENKHPRHQHGLELGCQLALGFGGTGAREKGRGRKGEGERERERERERGGSTLYARMPKDLEGGFFALPRVACVQVVVFEVWAATRVVIVLRGYLDVVKLAACSTQTPQRAG